MAKDKSSNVKNSPTGNVDKSELPPLDFTTFVLSLSTSAIIHLGDAPNEGGAKSPVDLPMAKQTIDLLSMLEDKTKGNLSGEEERLLHQVVTDLKLRYIKKKS